MTKQLRALIDVVSKTLPVPKLVVEVGSRHAVNQSEIADMRPFFSDSKYVGLDMEAGPGVDLVMRGEKLPYNDNSVDLVLCLETFEHCDKPWEVAKEIERVVKKTESLLLLANKTSQFIFNHLTIFDLLQWG